MQNEVVDERNPGRGSSDPQRVTCERSNSHDGFFKYMMIDVS